MIETMTIFEIIGMVTIGVLAFIGLCTVISLMDISDTFRSNNDTELFRFDDTPLWKSKTTTTYSGKGGDKEKSIIPEEKNTI